MVIIGLIQHQIKSDLANENRNLWDTQSGRQQYMFVCYCARGIRIELGGQLDITMFTDEQDQKRDDWDMPAGQYRSTCLQATMQRRGARWT